MNLPQGQRGQLVAVTLLLIVLFLFYKLAVAPLWQQYAGLREEIDEAAFDLQRYQRIADGLPALREQHQKLVEEQPLKPFVFNGKNRALAGAALQRHLQAIAGRNEGRVLSARTLKHEADGPMEAVILSARLQIPVDGLQKLVHELENGQPMIRIDQINISAIQSRGRQRAGMLDVRMTLSGLRIPSAEDGASG